MRLFILLIFLITTLCARLPSYAVKMAKNFNVPVLIATTWSHAESTHNLLTNSHKNAYGRYQITLVCFKHYCDITGRNIDNIKNIPVYLYDDFNNCFIAYFMYAFWRRLGYSPRQIMQIWLFGERGYLTGRYSYSFERKIFPVRVVYK